MRPACMNHNRKDDPAGTAPRAVHHGAGVTGAVSPAGDDQTRQDCIYSTTRQLHAVSRDGHIHAFAIRGETTLLHRREDDGSENQCAGIKKRMRC
jgi:hypothetical protein